MWRLVKPYWSARENRWSWPLAIFLLLLIPVSAGLHYAIARYTGETASALVARRRSEYASLFWLVAGLTVGKMFLDRATFYLGQLLEIHWRRWLTDYLVRRYLGRRVYYDIASRDDLDNPDQRLQEQVMPFVRSMAYFPQQLLGQVVQLLTGGVIVASVAESLVWYVVGYAAVQTVVTFWMYLPTIRLNFEHIVAEADLRRVLLHVRENAETVALYGGERGERAQIEDRLRTAAKRQRGVVHYENVLVLVGEALGIAWTVAPFFLIVPMFFEGKIPYGSIAMATASATMMMKAFGVLSQSIPMLASMVPYGVRLAQILERYDELGEDPKRCAGARITRERGDLVALRSVRVETPDGQRQLSAEIDLVVGRGDRVLVTGRSGVGKTSLVRAMAGLWDRGAGTMAMPPPEECMFLPQRPYMVLSDLRAQLLYPRLREDLDDEVLRDMLARVQLPHLLERHGGLGAVCDWAKILSLGEQQRLGFARLLLSGARFAFLDEATSACDTATEAHLYQLLIDAGIACVSVGHRQTLVRFHNAVLHMGAEKASQLP